MRKKETDHGVRSVRPLYQQCLLHGTRVRCSRCNHGSNLTPNGPAFCVSMAQLPSHRGLERIYKGIKAQTDSEESKELLTWWFHPSTEGTEYILVRCVLVIAMLSNVPTLITRISFQDIRVLYSYLSRDVKLRDEIRSRRTKLSLRTQSMLDR